MQRTGPIDPSRYLTLPGRGSSPGVAVGALIRNRLDLASDAANGRILVAERAVPDDVGRILSAAGTLTLGGAVLSHVSLLSREFGKPSVALGRGTPARLLTGGGSGLLELTDVVGTARPPVLDEGDVVLLDGDAGRVHVPGGLDPELRRRVRRVHSTLAMYGERPEDDTLLLAIVRDLETDSETLLDFVLEAGLAYRVIPAGRSSVSLIAALAASGSRGAILQSRIDRLVTRTGETAAARCAEAGEMIAVSDEPDDLLRRMRRVEDSLNADIGLLRDLGAPTEEISIRLAELRREAGERRAFLREAVLGEVRRALEVSDDAVRHRVGGLYRLLRRAAAAQLGADEVARLRARLARQVADERARAGAHLVVPLQVGDGLRERSLVGGKADGLLQAIPVLPPRCRVPRGFVVTSTAYRLHLLGETGETVRDAAGSDLDESTVSRRVRAALLSAELPAEVVAEVRSALSSLGDARLAVRSSATIEDGPAGSLAGQFDTYLGVRGVDELLDRIRWAWASLWNARALRTLAASGHSALSANQAVVVQEVVETVCAGVLFSRDPVGRPDTLMINANWGLGEGISQGEVGGDVYWVRRDDGEVLASEIGLEQTMIVLDPDRTGTLELPVPEDCSGKPCLTSDRLARLAELARALEDATGRAQDIEFGFADDDSLVVFQVRRLVHARR